MGLLGAKEGASWLQSLGLSRWDWSEAEATGKGLSQSKISEVPVEKQSHFLSSPAEMLCDLPLGWGPQKPEWPPPPPAGDWRGGGPQECRSPPRPNPQGLGEGVAGTG